MWIGSSCGQHSSYTFYRGFRLIVDGTVKNYCLGEFYFVRNSANQPICIAELQLVWYDSSTDSQLASARLYFRPEDTPAGRLSCHGRDELLYADQKVVIKCLDMAIWQDPGDDWSFGLIPLCESDLECIDSKYYLKCNHVEQEAQQRAWLKGEHPRTLHILTFPAYCRYRALMKRLSNGVCFTRTQLIALGGVITEHKNTRVVFCRDSFHHPYLDKFELSGETKAPVLKGRPRKKRRLHGVSSSVLSKKRFVADIQNHLISHLGKKSKYSEEEESAESDRSEDVLEKIKSLPQRVTSDQNNGPPPLIKSRIEMKSVERSSIDLKNMAVQDVSQRRGERHRIPPPLIPSNQAKGNVSMLAQKKSSHEQNGSVCSYSRTDSGFAPLSSSEKQVDEAQEVTNYPTASATSKSLLVKKIQEKANMVPVISSYGSPSGYSPVQTSVTSNCQTLQTAAIVTNSQCGESSKLSTMLSTQPASSADGRVCIALETSQKPDMRAQPVTPRLLAASVQRSHTSMQVAMSVKSNTVPVSVHTVTSSTNMVSGTTIPSSQAEIRQTVANNCDVTAKAVMNKESGTRQLRLQSVSESKTDEYEFKVEPVVWRKKKRLRMPGSIKDEEYEDDDEKYFMQTLRDFMKSRNTPLGKIPALGFKKVNLWTMYTTAQRFGGYDAVTSKRMWRRVYDSLGGSTTITSAATYTRRHYERLLLPYERHIRSQLRDKVDRPVSTTLSSHAEMAQKEPPVLSTKQASSLPSAIAKCVPESSVCFDKKYSPPAKSSQADSQTAQSRNLVSNTTVLARNTMPSNVTRTLDHRGMLVDQQPWDASSNFVKGNTIHTSATPTNSKVSSKATCATTIAFNPHAQESHCQSGRDGCQVSPVRTSTAVPAVATRAEGSSSQGNVVHHRVKLETEDKWTSARTSAVYAKSSVAGTLNVNSSTEPSSLQRVVRKRNSNNLVPQSAQYSDQVYKAKEVIDLTSDDSSPVPKRQSPSLVKRSSENIRRKPESSGPPRLRGPDSRQDTGHLQTLDEHHDQVNRCHSVRDSQQSVDVTAVQSTKSYNAPKSSRVSLQVHESSVPQNAYSTKDEAYYNARKEIACQKPEKTRNLQTHVETSHGKRTLSPSLERVDEHFTQWHRSQSGLQQHHSRHGRATHTRYPADEHELSQLRYTYVNEDMCDQDCACSMVKKRKDNAALAPTPRMKKEHYEDDLSFTGMAVYPGRWTPPVVPDHSDLYITSHADYMQGSPGPLSSHMCTTSRVFLPQSQIFSSPYHMGMTPVGAPALLASSDDRLHIHPHCLIPSPYPCTSNSRASEAGSYPLYSFT